MEDGKFIIRGDGEINIVDLDSGLEVDNLEVEASFRNRLNNVVELAGGKIITADDVPKAEVTDNVVPLFREEDE